MISSTSMTHSVSFRANECLYFLFFFILVLLHDSVLSSQKGVFAQSSHQKERTTKPVSRIVTLFPMTLQNYEKNPNPNSFWDNLHVYVMNCNALHLSIVGEITTFSCQ